MRVNVELPTAIDAGRRPKGGAAGARVVNRLVLSGGRVYLRKIIAFMKR